MRDYRFWVRSLDQSPVRLDTDEAHHLKSVMRLKKGDGLVLFDGKGNAANGTVERMENDEVWIALGRAAPSLESPLDLTLAIAPPKGDRMTTMVRMLSELGVKTIIPILTEHSEWSREQIERRAERWERIALEACKQSGRARVPTIQPPADVASVFETENDGSVFIADPGAGQLSLSGTKPDATVKILIGPEGGWSPAEIALAEEHQAQRFSLGPRTMRVETAAVAVTSLFQWLCGDWQ